MKNNSPLYDDEIDLIALFKIIWDGKIKILLITIISFLIGFGYSYLIPNVYLNSLTINKIDDYKIYNIQYIVRYINSNLSTQFTQLYTDRFINAQGLDGSDEDIADVILNRFIQELKNTIKDSKIILNSSIKGQKVPLINYSNLININKLNNQNDIYILNFKWHNPDEAKKILQDILTLASNRFINLFFNDLIKIIEIEKKFILAADNSKLEFLLEHSLIAKELQILDSQKDALGLSQSSILFNLNASDWTYYLRGSKVIDKEIEILKERKYPKFKFIEKEVNSLKEANMPLVKFDINSINSKSLKDIRSILIISILLGLIIGIFYLLISNSFLPKKGSKGTN